MARSRLSSRLPLLALAILGMAVVSNPASSQPLDRFNTQRARMVEEIQARGIADTAVLEALSRVPRHLFVPLPARPGAYSDTPLPIGHGQTISQPYIVALMTSLLEVKPGDRVLEIGTGSGYQAAVLAEMGAEVWTIEIVAPLGQQARRTLDELGYRGVRTRIGDGYQGWPGEAPFDAIVVTAAPPSIPQPLLDQVAVGGRVVLPVGEAWQDLLVLTKRPDGSFKRRSVLPVRFVPMTGEAQRDPAPAH
jgi:protein-L-isoaspartate(D-aspartate) O-methyltransferase